jgi:hypothetical protein
MDYVHINPVKSGVIGTRRKDRPPQRAGKAAYPPGGDAFSRMIFLPHLPRVELRLDGEPLDADVALAAGFLSRFRGLMLTARPEMGRGLLIAPCNGIHLLGMRYPLEAVFLSPECRVLKAGLERLSGRARGPTSALGRTGEKLKP